MNVFEFALVVMGVSASGVMAPGPLFAANVAYGIRGGGKTGLKMALGHAAVELPLIVLLGIGVFSLESLPGFRTAIAAAGAAALFAFAALQIRAALCRQTAAPASPRYGPLVAGIAFSALNPFFVAWWLTIGLKLVSDAMLAWAFGGVLIMFVMHIWMDFAWLGAVSYMASKSSKILSGRRYRVVMAGLGAVMAYFGIVFLGDAGLIHSPLSLSLAHMTR